MQLVLFNINNLTQSSKIVKSTYIQATQIVKPNFNELCLIPTVKTR
jgi:hypothetical protein